MPPSIYGIIKVYARLIVSSFSLQSPPRHKKTTKKALVE
jgi:hypothetical protein